jgi:hypothetical protein
MRETANRQDAKDAKDEGRLNRRGRGARAEDTEMKRDEGRERGRILRCGSG